MTSFLTSPYKATFPSGFPHADEGLIENAQIRLASRISRWIIRGIDRINSPCMIFFPRGDNLGESGAFNDERIRVTVGDNETKNVMVKLVKVDKTQ